MPITSVVKGDLVDLANIGSFDAIVHGCNCFCTMNSGVAKAIRYAFPDSYRSDCRTKKGDFKKLGSYTKALVDLENGEVMFVINLYTQFDYGYDGTDRLNYGALEFGFGRINQNFKGFHIGIPKIGCGLAGGDWDRAQEIINRVTPDLEITYVEFE